MNILITGAAGFVGKNLTAALECLRDGKDRTRPGLAIGEIYRYDMDSPAALLEEACQKADFVFNLAGVNRPQNQEEFMQGNFGFASTLLDTLKKYKNTCPVMLSSSIQATLVGRYANGEYGKSKKAGEELFFRYAEETGAKVLVYRFPNLFGKWCRPNYNSAVATFCNNIANDLPIQVNDRRTELELLYIDDLVEEMVRALEGKAHRCDYDGLTPLLREDGQYCVVPVTHRATLGEIVDLLKSFRSQLLCLSDDRNRMAQIIQWFHTIDIHTDTLLSQKSCQFRIASPSFMSRHIKRYHSHFPKTFQSFINRCSGLVKFTIFPPRIPVFPEFNFLMKSKKARC